jgi:hypothetical protein
MASSDLLQKLQALDLQSLSEEERQSALVEARAQIAALSNKQKDVEVLFKRIALLKIWQQLVQLRVDDVRAEVAPPFSKTKAERLFEAPDSDAAEEQTRESVEETAETLAVAEEGDGFVMVRLLEAGIVRGMKLPAGITIEASQEDADNLLDTGKAIRVVASETNPGDDATPSDVSSSQAPTPEDAQVAGSKKRPTKKKSKKDDQS